MFSKMEFKGRWNQIQGKIKDKWGQLTEEDLASVEGNLENLLWVVQKKTGSEKREIEDYVDQCFKKPSPPPNTPVKRDQRDRVPAMDSIMSAPTTVALEASEAVQVPSHIQCPSPMDLAASVFTAGFLSGVIFGLLSRAPY